MSASVTRLQTRAAIRQRVQKSELPVLSDGQRDACAISAWMFVGGFWLATGFIAGYSVVTLVGVAVGLA